MRVLVPIGAHNRLALIGYLIFITTSHISPSSASIAIENVDFDLVRLVDHFGRNSTDSQRAEDPTYLVEPLSAVESSLHNDNADGQTQLVVAASKVPVYHSAPKQIDNLSSLNEEAKRALKSPASEPLVEVRPARQPNDLAHAAAGHYAPRKHKKKKKKKKKVVKVKVIKKKKKKVKMTKTVVVKKKKKSIKYKKPKKMVHLYVHKKEPEYHHHEPSHAGGHDKYYEFRSVPAKGSWKFGFKRGNEKHKIERDEHGHKSHFKTLFKWKDPKGLGKHLFDYNHGDHYKKKKHKKYHAAASEEAPKTSPVSNSTQQVPLVGKQSA